MRAIEYLEDPKFNLPVRQQFDLADPSAAETMATTVVYAGVHPNNQRQACEDVVRSADLMFFDPTRRAFLADVAMSCILPDVKSGENGVSVEQPSAGAVALRNELAGKFAAQALRTNLIQRGESQIVGATASSTMADIYQKLKTRTGKQWSDEQCRNLAGILTEPGFNAALMVRVRASSPLTPLLDSDIPSRLSVDKFVDVMVNNHQDTPDAMYNQIYTMHYAQLKLEFVRNVRLWFEPLIHESAQMFGSLDDARRKYDPAHEKEGGIPEPLL